MKPALSLIGDREHKSHVTDESYSGILPDHQRIYNKILDSNNVSREEASQRYRGRASLDPGARAPTEFLPPLRLPYPPGEAPQRVSSRYFTSAAVLPPAIAPRLTPGRSHRSWIG
jgi:hypothetical protein